jgi:hypothetical protein
MWAIGGVDPLEDMTRMFAHTADAGADADPWVVQACARQKRIPQRPRGHETDPGAGKSSTTMGKVSKTATPAQKQAYYGSVVPNVAGIRRDEAHARKHAAHAFDCKSGLAFDLASKKMAGRTTATPQRESRVMCEVYKKTATQFLYNAARAEAAMSADDFAACMAQQDARDARLADEQRRKADLERELQKEHERWRREKDEYDRECEARCALRTRLRRGEGGDVPDADLVEFATKSLREYSANKPSQFNDHERPLERIACCLNRRILLEDDNVAALPNTPDKIARNFSFNRRELAQDLFLSTAAITASETRVALVTQIVARAWPGAPKEARGHELACRLEALAAQLREHDSGRAYQTLATGLAPVLEQASLQSNLDIEQRKRLAEQLRGSMS